VKEREFQCFHEAVSDGGLWWTAHPSSPNPNITERYSHSACYLNKCLYIFGGCTSNNTAFNDLWKLDLGIGEWIRPLAMGKITYHYDTIIGIGELSSVSISVRTCNG